MAKQIWATKYRPSDIDEFVFTDEIQESKIRGMLENKSIPHLLLSGSPGTGKTSLAYVIKNELEIDDSDFLVLNASDENSVDTVRTKIKNFISTMAVGELKIVFLDEADHLSIAAQSALRNMMETYDQNARFILSCNYLNKISPAIISRCQSLSFKTLDQNYVLALCAKILSEENVNVTKKTFPKIKEYIDCAYPDLRKTINLLQANVIGGELIPLSDSNTDDSSLETFAKILDLLENDTILQNREFTYSLTDDDCLDMYRKLSEYIEDITVFDSMVKRKAAIIVIAEGMYKHSLTAIKPLTLEACLIKLRDLC